MLVETFECQETAEEPIEAAEEAIGLIESLGLEGQKTLLSPKEQLRSPYRKIRKDETFVYRTICPVEVSLAQYEASPIPLRVLQIAAHAKSLNLYKGFWVWSQAGAEKDPVLVASDKEKDWDKGEIYILARWGEELETFAVLLERAVEMVRKKTLQQLKELESTIKAASDQTVIDKGPNNRIYW